MNTNSADSNGPGSPYDPFPTPRIYPDKWDLSELVSGHQAVGDNTPIPPMSAAGQDTTSMTDGFADESSTNAL